MSDCGLITEARMRGEFCHEACDACQLFISHNEEYLKNKNYEISLAAKHSKALVKIDHLQSQLAELQKLYDYIDDYEENYAPGIFCVWGLRNKFKEVARKLKKILEKDMGSLNENPNTEKATERE